MEQTAPTIKSSDSLSKKIFRGLGFALGTSFIFLFGFGVGGGRLILPGDKRANLVVQSELPADLDYSSIEIVYDALRRNFDGDLTHQGVLDGLKKGLADSTGDPYTEYMSAEEAKEFEGQLNGTFVGIGAELGKDDQDNIIVVSPLSGFPAEKAGLKPKDIITKVDGESISGQTISEVVKRIRGEQGVEVVLTIVRDKAIELEIKIVREEIKIPSVEYEILEGNIGYLRISRFSNDTTEIATKAANVFKAKNVKGVVVDVRSDPGGLLGAAVEVSSLWLPKGAQILQEKRDTLVIKDFKSSGVATLNGVPTVVLVNEGSASASEILAGALRDNNAATVMGKQTFGKGSVQQIEPFVDGSILKVTIARWYTPNGINIDKDGITPDTEVELDEDKFKDGTDTQLEAAKKALK